MDTNIETIKEKLLTPLDKTLDQENSQISIPKAKLIDFSYFLENNAGEKEKSFLGKHTCNNTSSLTRANALDKEFKISSQRVEVKHLEEWLNSMLENENAKTSDLQTKFLNIQLIYTASLKELIRQVSLQCADRGFLIQRIWDEYLHIVERAIFLERSKAIETEKSQISEITKLHALYNSEITTLTANYSSLLKKYENCMKKNEKLKQEKTYVTKLQTTSLKNLKELESNLEELRKEYDKLLNENFNLKLINDGTSSPTLRINKAHNSRHVESTPSHRLLKKNTRNIEISPFSLTSVVSHLVEYKEKETHSRFERMKTIEVIQDKKGNNIHQHMINSDNNHHITEKEKPLLLVETENKEIEKKQNDSAFLYELDEKAVGTEDLIIYVDQEVNTELHQLKRESRSLKEVGVDENEVANLRENAMLLEDMLDNLNIDQREKEELLQLAMHVKNTARGLLAKVNKLSFVENEVLSLKAVNTKIKMELSEMTVERDQLKETELGRQKDIIYLLKDYSKVKKENKNLKKDRINFQKSLENSEKIYLTLKFELI